MWIHGGLVVVWRRDCCVQRHVFSVRPIFMFIIYVVLVGLDSFIWLDLLRDAMNILFWSMFAPSSPDHALGCMQAIAYCSRLAVGRLGLVGLVRQKGDFLQADSLDIITVALESHIVLCCFALGLESM